MRNMKWYLRAALLLPLATVNYLKTQGTKGRAILIGVPAAVLVLILALALHHRDGKPEAAPVMAETSAVETAAVETTPTPPPTPSPVTITLSFAGDCTLGMDDYLGYEDSFNQAYDREGPAFFLEKVKPIFAADDLTVVNFEGPLTESTEKEDKSFAFKGHAEYASVLTEGAVEAANLANNHSHDYGDEGFDDTKTALDQAGITHFGYEDVAIVEVGGVKVGLTGQFTVYENPQHLEDLRNNIQTLKDRGAEVIVACFHWGMENDDTPDPDQVELAHAAIDAGAHLVIGHHPHVLQGVEVYQGRYIVYSVGNFCFGGNYSPPDYDAMIFQQTFTIQDGQVLTDDQVEVIPCLTSSAAGYNNFQPIPAEGEEKQRILEKLRDISDGLGEINIFEE